MADIMSVPSPPGYAVLVVDDYEVIASDPVIAFLIEREVWDRGVVGYTVSPITSEEVFTSSHRQPYGLLRPDGRVEVPAERTLDSIQDFVKHLSDEKAKRTDASLRPSLQPKD